MTTTIAARVTDTKRMLRRVLDASGLSARCVAARMDVPAHYVADMLNESEPQRPPFDLLAPFMDAVNDSEPIRWLAAKRGGVFVELPTLVAGAEDVYHTFLKAVSEVGEDSAAIERALSDREITDSEGQSIAAELDDTIAALVAVKLAVQAKAGKPSPARMTMPVTAAAPAVRRGA